MSVKMSEKKPYDRTNTYFFLIHVSDSYYQNPLPLTLHTTISRQKAEPSLVRVNAGDKPACLQLHSRRNVTKNL